MSTILNPQVKLELSVGDVVVTEMKWAAALAFIKKLAGHIGQLAKADGSFGIEFERLPELVVNTQELAQELIAQSTGHDADWINGLGTTDFLRVLDKALEVNLSQEVIGLGKSVGGRLQGAFSVTTPKTGTPSVPTTS
jgi:hypothetical protein